MPIEHRQEVAQMRAGTYEQDVGSASARAEDVELEVARIFLRIFKLSVLRPEDTFFSLGGDSLMATHLTAQVRKRLGIAITVRDVFAHPTVRQLAGYLAQTIASHVEPQQEVANALGENLLQLSFAQESMWFLEQLCDLGSAYHIVTSLQLSGRLDVLALERCFQEIVSRHETLRARFTAVDGVPHQIIDEDTSCQLLQVDLTHECDELRDVVAARLVREEAGRPFDLERAPLARFMLLKLEPELHVLLVAMHHIICDGWSMNILTRELSALYRAFSRGAPSPLGPLTAGYRNFCSWQRRLAHTASFQEQLAYWKKQLAGTKDLRLPTDRPRPPVSTFRGARLRLALPSATRAAMMRLVQSGGFTPFMVLLAGFQLLLAMRSGQDDICVGTPIAGRHQPEFEGVFGCFINTLVMRADLSGDPSFREVVHQVRTVSLGAYANSLVPVQILLAELQKDRTTSGASLFQVLFSLQNFEQQELDMSPLQVRLFERKEAGAQFDLSLHLFAGSQEIAGFFEYAADLFDPQTMDEFASEFQCTLAAVLANPDVRVSQLRSLVREGQAPAFFR